MITDLVWRTTSDPKATDRVLKVTDSFNTFYATLPSGMSIKDGCVDFVWSYDFDDYKGNIYCHASLFDNGVAVDALKFDFRDGSSHIEFAANHSLQNATIEATGECRLDVA